MADKETELVLYVEMENPDFPRSEGSEQWNQYETKFQNGTRARIRVYAGGEKSSPKCIQTVKVDAGMVGGIRSSDEYSCEVPAGFAEGFIKGCDSIQNKVRDYYKSNKVTLKLKRGDEVEEHTAPELGIEFDRFLKEDGTFHPWAKVDIEIDKLIDWMRDTYGKDKVSGYFVELENIVPTKIKRIIVSTSTDPEEKEILGTIWDTMFKKKLR